jgi:predicted alpha/beta hydrolase
MSAQVRVEPAAIPAADGFVLAATRYEPVANPTRTVVVINAATAVPQRYYRSFATFLAEQGYTTITYDYRGIGGSRPTSLRGFAASARDWVLLDMAGVIDWAYATYAPGRLFLVGHSYGGQTAGLLPNGDRVDAMVTSSSQSGYWALQGGFQRVAVAFHTHVTLPVLARLFGYVPWSRFSSAEDLPKGFALEWAAWCRQPGYLLDDPTLPLERFAEFRAPVLALSFADDIWGTRRSVDAMMRAYPRVERRHITPVDVGLRAIGHFGFFRSQSAALWPEIVAWLEQSAPPAATAAPRTDTPAAQLPLAATS